VEPAAAKDCRKYPGAAEAWLFRRQGAKFPVLITPHGFHLSGIDSSRKGILSGIFRYSLSADGRNMGMPVVIFT
jgi:hypothetical protein